MLTGAACYEWANRCLQQQLYFTFRTRYVRFSLPSDYILTSLQNGGVPLSQCKWQTVQHTSNFDVVFRFSIDAVSVQRAQNGSSWKGTWKGRWAMVWTEYPAGAIKCVDVTIIAACMLTLLSDHWCKVSPKHRLASLLPLMARSSRQMYIQHHIHPLNLIVPASY